MQVIGDRLLLFGWLPFLAAIFWSFFEWDGAHHRRFVGIGHFVRLVAEDHRFHGAMVVVAVLLAANLAKMLTLPLLAARLVLNVRSDRLRFALQAAFVTPMVVPAIVNVLLWRWIYADRGLVHHALLLIGRGAWQRAWLGEADTVIPALVFMGFPWISASAAFLLYLAGMLDISPDLLQAARVDGAGPLRRFWHVELPLIRAQIRLVVILVTLETIQAFYTIYLLTGGGPGDTSLVPGLHLYRQAFAHSHYGYASALGVVLFVIMLSLTWLNTRYLRSEVEHEA